MTAVKSDKSLLWIFGALLAVLGIMFFAIDMPLGFLHGGAPKPVPGKVYTLTAENLSAARRQAPVMVALFTSRGNNAGARMSRGLGSLAQRIKDRAIVAVGNLDEEPGLAAKAGVKELPAWVIYRGGTEVSRATGENADLSLARLIAEETGSAP